MSDHIFSWCVFYSLLNIIVILTELNLFKNCFYCMLFVMLTKVETILLYQHTCLDANLSAYKLWICDVRTWVICLCLMSYHWKLILTSFYQCLIFLSPNFDFKIIFIKMNLNISSNKFNSNRIIVYWKTIGKIKNLHYKVILKQTDLRIQRKKKKAEFDRSVRLIQIVLRVEKPQWMIQQFVRIKMCTRSNCNWNF